MAAGTTVWGRLFLLRGAVPTGHTLTLGDDRIAEATRWRYAFLVAQAGLSLILYVALGHVLGEVQFAAAATALGGLVIAQAVADFGLSQAAVAALPNRTAYGRFVEYDVMAAGAARAFIFGACMALGVAAGTALLVPSAARLPMLAIAPAAALTVVVAGTDGLLRSVGEFRRPVVYVTLSRVASLVAVPAAAASDSATWACMAMSAGAALGSSPALGYLTAVLRRGGPNPPVRAFIHAALPLGASNVLIVAGSRVNTVVLGAVGSLSAAAVFESAWRLFQAGQYLLGGYATAIGPFVSSALSDNRSAELRRLLLRSVALVMAAGCVLAGALIATRAPVCDALFGDLGDSVADSVVPLALALPASLLVLLATVCLAAASARERIWIMGSYGLGAVVNGSALAVLVGDDPLMAGAIGAAAGTVTTALVLGTRFGLFISRLAPVGQGEFDYSPRS